MPKDEIRMIAVEGNKVGMLGLEAIFTELKAANKKPSDELGVELVELAGKQNYIPPAARTEYARALLNEYRRYLGEHVPDVPQDSPSLSIKILGTGCPRCEALESNVLSALAELGIAADVEHVRDIAQIANYGVLGTPALVVNGKVRSVGKALSKDQVLSLLSRVT